MSLSIGKGWEVLCWLLTLVSNTWCWSGVVMGLQKHLQHHVLPAINCRASGACATGARTASTMECCRSSTCYYVLYNRISAKARTNLQLSSRGAVCRLGLGLGVTQLAEHLCPQLWSFPTSCLLDFSILQKYLKSKLKVCAQQHDTGHGFLWTTQVFSWENQRGMFE